MVRGWDEPGASARRLMGLAGVLIVRSSLCGCFMARLVVGIVFAAGLALSAAVAPPAEGPLSGLTATIHSQNDVPIAAEAEGVIIELPVREGSQVAVGDVLAAIDDRQAKAAVEVAKFALEAATEKANDTIEEDYVRPRFASPNRNGSAASEPKIRSTARFPTSSWKKRSSKPSGPSCRLKRRKRIG